jgi:hypothetical protein
MISINANAFTFPFTFLNEAAEKVIPELMNFGFSGVNLALNYHGSRDLLLRQGVQLKYLVDGFHYYKCDQSMYEKGALVPAKASQFSDNNLIEKVVKTAYANDFKINAWAVYMHNSAIGMENPDATVTNVFGNKFLSELCPINPSVLKYAIGLTKDLCNRGIAAITAESLHFHGARHGEHHERFFIQLSPISEFLFSLCFCTYCKDHFKENGFEPDLLANKVKMKLQGVFDSQDPWIGKDLSKELLGEIIGPEILDYLKCRENKLAQTYKAVVDVCNSFGVTFKFVDQSPLLDMESVTSTKNSWQVGVDNVQIKKIVDFYEPLLYRPSVEQVAHLAKDYLTSIGKNLTAILRPTFPDSTTTDNLVEKVSKLRDLEVSNIDFYLLDTMRKKDLQSISLAIN